MTTANKITITRILLIPCFVLMAVYYGRSVAEGAPVAWQRYAAILIFIIASASDGLDGYIARKYHQKTRLGSILDPLADKGLLLTALITLTASPWRYELPLWFLVLVIARDVVILSGCGVLQFLHGHVQIAPSWLGKATTASQMVAISWVMLQIPHLIIPVSIAGVVTFLSGGKYIIDGTHQLHSNGHGEAH